MSAHPANLLLSGALDPRYHAGVGFAQVYLPSGARLHMWHPEFPVEQESFGLRHNHRFDMTSHVLQGAVTHIPFSLVENPAAAFQRFAVLAAHHGRAEDPQPISDQRYSIQIDRPFIYRAGESYFFPKRHYHQSAGDAITVTLVEKSNQEEFQAEIIAPFDQPPKHGLDHNVSMSWLLSTMVGVIAGLDDAAIDKIEPHLEAV